MAVVDPISEEKAAKDAQGEGTMNKRRSGSIGTGGRFVTLALLLALALAPSRAVAGDLTTGSSTITDDDIIGTAFDTLVSCIFTLPAGTTHMCIATCSAEVDGTSVPGGSTDNDYELGLGLNSSFPFESRRSFELNGNAGPDAIEVTTTHAFVVAGGTHTISCAARKLAPADATMTISDSSITCHCGHSTHQ